MSKELVREIPFGGATARITVRGSKRDEVIDGFVLKEQKFNLFTDIDIIKDGIRVTTDSKASEKRYEENEHYYNRNKLNKEDTFSIVGKAMTLGTETALEINKAVREMRDEICLFFCEKTDAEREVIRLANKAIEKRSLAKDIVKRAEQEGIDNLLTVKELQKWVKNYNDVVNEGGDGYIPTRVSKEQYEEAIKYLGGN